MEGNLEGSRTTVEVFLHIISDVPAAAATLREWLADAEAQTPAQDPGDSYWEDTQPDDAATVDSELF